MARRGHADPNRRPDMDAGDGSGGTSRLFGMVRHKNNRATGQARTPAHGEHARAGPAGGQAGGLESGGWKTARATYKRNLLMTAFAKEQIALQTVSIIMGLCAALFMIILCVGLTWMLYGDDEPPFVSVKARVLDSYGNERYTFRPGEVMQIRRDFCVERNIPVQVGRELRNVNDNSAILMESTHQVYRKGCSEGGNIVQVPVWAPSGVYEYRVSVLYANNFLRQDTTALAPVSIEIVK